MQAAPTQTAPTQTAPAQTLAERCTLIVTGLRALLAAHMVRADRTRPLLILVYGRLGRLDRRIATLLQRLAAGHRVAPRPPAATTRAAPSAPASQHPAGQPPAGQHPAGQDPAGQPPAGQPPARPRRASLRLPTKPGWLVTEVRQSVTYGNYFCLLLQDPGMVALLEAAPQLKRQLRSLLRLLMFELPPVLALPPRPPRAPRPKPPRAARPKKPRRAPCHGAWRPEAFWRGKELWRPGPIRPIWTA